MGINPCPWPPQALPGVTSVKPTMPSSPNLQVVHKPNSCLSRHQTRTWHQNQPAKERKGKAVLFSLSLVLTLQLPYISSTAPLFMRQTKHVPWHLALSTPERKSMPQPAHPREGLQGPTPWYQGELEAPKLMGSEISKDVAACPGPVGPQCSRNCARGSPKACICERVAITSLSKLVFRLSVRTLPELLYAPIQGKPAINYGLLHGREVRLQEED